MLVLIVITSGFLLVTVQLVYRKTLSPITADFLNFRDRRGLGKTRCCKGEGPTAQRGEGACLMIGR